MKKRIVLIVLIVFMLESFAQDYTEYISSGLDAYARSDWASAIFSFQKAEYLSNGQKDEPVYWAVMANASARNYQEALNGAEDFLNRFPNSRKIGEIVYQQGRMYCLCAEHEKSINTLYGFLSRFPNHRQIPSAYYWIGENLYMAGRLKDARVIFSRLILDYPTSAKVPPARYKIALIDQAATQDELLKLLKLSHEELLKVSEDYEKNKKSYEQTINSYQKQIGEVNRNTKLAELAEKLQTERQKNEEVYERLSKLEQKNKELEVAIETLNEGKKEIDIANNTKNDIGKDEPIEEKLDEDRIDEYLRKHGLLPKEDSVLKEEAISETEPVVEEDSKEAIVQENIKIDLEKRKAYIHSLKSKVKLLQNMYDKLLEENDDKE